MTASYIQIADENNSDDGNKNNNLYLRHTTCYVE